MPSGSRGASSDAVIVEGGVCGATVAHKLSQAGKRVLLLEAGTSDLLDPNKYRSYLENYYVTGGLRSTLSNQSRIPQDAGGTRWKLRMGLKHLAVFQFNFTTQSH
jgi:choline dehydrogenase-like flavoprotein